MFAADGAAAADVVAAVAALWIGQMSSLEAPIRQVGTEELREEEEEEEGFGGFILPMPFSKWVNLSLPRNSPDLPSSQILYKRNFHVNSVKVVDLERG